MKRFIRATAVVLPLFFLAACSKAPEANEPTTSPGASTATITASPNPVPVTQGPATTTITWNTGDRSGGQVYLSKDGGPEALFGGLAPTGSVTTAPWIEAGSTYEFRLYAGSEHTKMLAKTTVTAQK
jgi:ABC-type transport system substrate-binding protein